MIPVCYFESNPNCNNDETHNHSRHHRPAGLYLLLPFLLLLPLLSHDSLPKPQTNNQTPRTPGGSVASFFLTLPSWTIRGLTRNSLPPRAQHLSSLGMQLIRAELSIPSTLPVAFAGATAIFSVTDFWGSYYSPSTASVLKPGESLAQYCKEQERIQGVNKADAASKVVGVERLVVSALCNAGERDGGSIRMWRIGIGRLRGWGI